MPFYTKPRSQLGVADLEELLADGAVENLRLEFKLKVPDKLDTLKKLSSFANTFGGFMVVGAEAEKDGRIKGLPGVDVEPGYKQKVVDWCSSSASPPFYVEVSDPIPAPNSSTKVCYVVYTAESEVAPHFLNGRNGVWVRTDEFSKTVQVQLATELELRGLLDRRRLVRDRRTNLIARTKQRFNTYAKKQYTDTGGSPTKRDPVIEIVFVPRFPARPLCGQEELINHVRSSGFHWRSGKFPSTSSPTISQHESLLTLDPARPVSIFEVNVWGMLFYGTYMPTTNPSDVTGIHINRVIGSMLVFVVHAGKMIQALGYSGPIMLDVSLRSIIDVSWVHAWQGYPEKVGGSRLDDEVTFNVQSTTDDLRDRPYGVLIEILRQILFSVDLAGYAGSTQNLETIVKKGYEYNGWEKPTTLRI